MYVTKAINSNPRVLCDSYNLAGYGRYFGKYGGFLGYSSPSPRNNILTDKHLDVWPKDCYTVG
jgi:hypothetical protein